MCGRATLYNCIINTSARTYWHERFLECHVSNTNIMLIEVRALETTAGNLMLSFGLRCFALPWQCCQHLRHRTSAIYLRYLTSEANTELYCLDFQHNCSGVRGRDRLKRERTKTGRVSGTPDTLCWGETAQAQGRVTAFLLLWTIQTVRLLVKKKDLLVWRMMQDTVICPDFF